MKFLSVAAISKWGAWVAGTILLLSCFVVALEVVLRKAFGVTLGSIDELLGYALAFAGAWGLSYALVTKAHIRIDVIYERLPERWQASLDLLNLACLIVSFGVLAWFGWRMTAGSYSFGSRSMTTMQTPLVFPQSVWILGISFFLCVALLLLLRAMRALLSGNVALARSIAGPLSASEEVRESMAEAAAIIRDSDTKR